MKIEISNSMKVAQKVLKQVEKYLAPVKSKDARGVIYLQAYQNGREQGYALNTIGRWVGWAENRNSDNIVVYVSDTDPMQSINDEMYRTRQMFQYNEMAKAARFIANQFVFQFSMV